MGLDDGLSERDRWTRDGLCPQRQSLELGAASWKCSRDRSATLDELSVQHVLAAEHDVVPLDRAHVLEEREDDAHLPLLDGVRKSRELMRGSGSNFEPRAKTMVNCLSDLR